MYSLSRSGRRGVGNEVDPSVGAHHDDQVRLPPARLERRLDQRAIGRVESAVAESSWCREPRSSVGPEHAVVRRNLLLAQRPGRREALADVLEGAAERTHLAIAERRADGLRRQAGVVDAD